MKSYFAFFAIVVIGLCSCKKQKNNNDKPVITFMSMNPNTVISGNGKDTVSISFRVVDGNGDITHGDPNKGYDIYLKDSRTGSDIQFMFPEIPEGTIDPNEGVNAVCTINIYAALFLLVRPDHVTGDTLTYDIYVKDKADNISNIITTPKIYIQPQP